MQEDILQFIWQHRLLKPVNMSTAGAKQVKIVSPGTLNRDAGPDFFNAQIIIDDVTLSGNVEIHVRTSDWTRHHHDTDPSYDRIILHAVFEHDGPIVQNEKHRVEVLELRNYIEEGIIERYQELAVAKQNIPCHPQLATADDVTFIAWIERLAVERLEQKVERVGSLIRDLNGDYTNAIYILLLQAFGFSVNSGAFEQLARRLPVHILLRHSNNLLQLEAMLLGMAGMLDEQLQGCHLHDLQNEFVFLERKYHLNPLRKELFKYSRMRPANFPALRLAQFAAMLHRQPRLITSPLSFSEKNELVRALRAEMSDYWKSHYDTGGASSHRVLQLGEAAAEGLVINVFAPFFFYTGKTFSKSEHCDTALSLLEQCAPEHNRKTDLFPGKSRLVKTARYSQGLIQLADHYCFRKQCLRCAIGASLISPPATKVSRPVPA